MGSHPVAVDLTNATKAKKKNIHVVILVKHKQAVLMYLMPLN
jgi:hypothetical protein